MYTIIKQWKTMNGEYHSATTDKSNYDSAIGEYHSMFKPMQNDANVISFVFTLIDEYGNRVEKCEWRREIPEETEEG